MGCAVAGQDAILVPGRVGALIDCLAERVGSVVVLAYDPPAAPTLEDKVDYAVRARNVTICSLGPKGSWRDRRRRRARIHEVISHRADRWDVTIFKLPNRRASAVSMCLDKERTIAVVVGHTPSVVWRARWPIARKFFVLAYALWAERTYHRIIRHSDATFVNSEALRRRYGPGAKEIHLVPLSSRRRRFSRQVADRMIGGEVNIMISGRITAEKGVFEALEAFSMLRAGPIPGAKLHVVGDGPDLGALRDRSRELGLDGSVVFHGWVPVGERLFATYARMDVLLLPSYAEGMPYTVWEALAHSVLVVCTPVGGIGHALAHEREVLFVPTRDAPALAGAVRRLRDDPQLRRRLIDEGYRRAEPMNLDEAVDGLIAVIEGGRSAGAGS